MVEPDRDGHRNTSFSTRLGYEVSPDLQLELHALRHQGHQAGPNDEAGDDDEGEDEAEVFCFLWLCRLHDCTFCLRSLSFTYLYARYSPKVPWFLLPVPQLPGAP